MATPTRRTHSLIGIIGPIFAALKRDMIDLLAGITGGAVTDPGHNHAVTDPGHTHTVTVRRTDVLGPLAAPGTNYVAQYAAGAPIDDAAGPFVQFIPARTVQVTVGAMAVPMVVTVNGTDINGTALEEVINVAAPGTTQGARAFATVTRVRTDVNPGDTVDVEAGAGVGLSRGLATIHGVSVDGELEAPTSTHVGTGTVVPATPPDGTAVFAVEASYAVTSASGTTGLTVDTDTTGVTVPGVAGVPPVHMDRSERTVTVANASDLDTSVALVNQIRAVYEFHRVDLLAHLVADTTNDLEEPVATDLTTAVDLANEIKAAYNAHRSQAGVHPAADTGHAIAASDATDQSSLNTLLNELKADLNLHMAAGLASASWRVEAA